MVGDVLLPQPDLATESSFAVAGPARSTRRSASRRVSARGAGGKGGAGGASRSRRPPRARRAAPAPRRPAPRPRRGRRRVRASRRAAATARGPRPWSRHHCACDARSASSSVRPSVSASRRAPASRAGPAVRREPRAGALERGARPPRRRAASAGSRTAGEVALRPRAASASRDALAGERAQHVEREHVRRALPDRQHLRVAEQPREPGVLDVARRRRTHSSASRRDRDRLLRRS